MTRGVREVRNITKLRTSPKDEISKVRVVQRLRKRHPPHTRSPPIPPTSLIPPPRVQRAQRSSSQFPAPDSNFPSVLDRVLDGSVLALDPGLDHARVAEDEDGGGADEPEDGAEGGREPEKGDADHEEAGVERLLSDDVIADLYRVGG